ncbi:hypothetical protein ACEPAI_188 [Sanghuangporus weigelae]
MAPIAVPTSSKLEPELDLSRAEDVIAYLADTPFASNHAETLSGGTVNFINRLHLVNPLVIVEGAQTVILKHAWRPIKNSYLKPDGRQDNGITFCESASRELGTALGRFLTALHVHGSTDSELPDAVRKNDDGRRITPWITYGQLLDTLKRSTQNIRLIEPLAGAEAPSEAEIEEISALADATIKKIYEAQTIFTMGNFWAGNVIVRLTNNGAIERMFVVDWEFAKPGIAFVDFAQFAAEMHTLKRFHPEATVSVDSALRTYGEAYKKASAVGGLLHSTHI